MACASNSKTNPFVAGAAYAALGDRANMLASLDTAERSFDMAIRWATVDPVFDAYRSDLALQEIIRRAMTPR